MSLLHPRQHEPRPAAARAAVPGRDLVDLVIPVHNEAQRLETCLRALLGRLTETPGLPVRISIANAASTDDTLAIAERLAREFTEVRVFHLNDPDRGRALRTVWEHSDAAVLAHLELGMPLEPVVLQRWLAPVFERRCDLVIGARAALDTAAGNPEQLPMVSRYRRLLHRNRLPAPPGPGFTAVRADRVPSLLKLVTNDGCLLDARLQAPARRAGLRIDRFPPVSARTGI